MKSKNQGEKLDNSVSKGCTVDFFTAKIYAFAL